jgi:vacuolar-type H+-ATPase subunit E/Vma4
VTRAGLIEALQRKAAEDVEALWRDARAEADRLRLEAARGIEEQRRAAAEQAAAAAGRLARAVAAQAERDVRDSRTDAASALATRLYGLARAELPRLAAERRGTLFAALTAELPSLAWQKLRVNPADESAARRQFPQAEVDGDPTVAGGVDAEADSGRIRVNNTLDARLETAWPDILPGLIASILTESADHGTPA